MRPVARRAGALLLFAGVLLAAAPPARADSFPPVIDLVIRDPQDGWFQATTMTEAHTYAFDASGTTDDSLVRPEDNVNLTFSWEFGDGTTLGPGPGRDGLINVSHAYAVWGQYQLNLTVVDLAGRRSELHYSISVQADPALRPDLRIGFRTIVMEPPEPEEGQEVRVRFELSNEPDHATARHLQLQVYLPAQDPPGNLTYSRLRLLGADGVPLSELAAGQTAIVEFYMVLPVERGERMIVIRIWDQEEPTVWIDSRNSQTFVFEVLPPITITATTFAIAGLVAASMVVTTLFWGRRKDRPRPSTPPERITPETEAREPEPPQS